MTINLPYSCVGGLHRLCRHILPLDVLSDSDLFWTRRACLLDDQLENEGVHIRSESRQGGLTRVLTHAFLA